MAESAENPRPDAPEEHDTQPSQGPNRHDTASSETSAEPAGSNRGIGSDADDATAVPGPLDPTNTQAETMPRGIDPEPNTVDATAPLTESAATQRLESLSGKTVGGYEVVSMIGRGNMGIVYRARQRGVGGRDVALKVMSPQAAEDPTARQRFRLEAPAAGTLETEFVTRVIEYRNLDGLEFLVMEYVGGGTLLDHADDHGGRMPIPEAARLLLEACRGLHAAETHKDEDGTPRPIYHRDIKPRNILLKETIDNGVPTKHVRIGDFGAAKIGDADLTQYTRAPMTPRYASPEQWTQDSNNVDHRSDMYSLGATFYEMLVGRAATAGLSQDQIHEFLMETESLDPREARPEIPLALSNVIRRLTARDPRSRYKSFSEPIQQLRLITEHKPVHVPAPKPVRKSAGSGWLVLVAVGVLGVVGWLVVRSPNQEQGPRPPGPLTTATAEYAADLRAEIARIRALTDNLPAPPGADLELRSEAAADACRRAEEFLGTATAATTDAAARMVSWKTTLSESGRPIEYFRSVASGLGDLERQLVDPKFHSSSALEAAWAELECDPPRHEVLDGLGSRLRKAAERIRQVRADRAQLAERAQAVPDATEHVSAWLGRVGSAARTLRSARETELATACEQLQSQLELVRTFQTELQSMIGQTWTLPQRYVETRATLDALPPRLREYALQPARARLDQWFGEVTIATIDQLQHTVLPAITSPLDSATEAVTRLAGALPEFPRRPAEWTPEEWAAWPKHVFPPPDLIAVRSERGYRYTFGEAESPPTLASYPLVLVWSRRQAFLIGQSELSVDYLRRLTSLTFVPQQESALNAQLGHPPEQRVDRLSHAAAAEIATHYATLVPESRPAGLPTPSQFRAAHSLGLAGTTWQASDEVRGLRDALLEWTDGKPNRNDYRSLLYANGETAEAALEKIERVSENRCKSGIGTRLAVTLRCLTLNGF